MKERDCFIKVTQNYTRIYGEENEVLTLVSCLVHNLIKSGLKKEDIEEAIKLGFLSEEEIDKMRKEKEEKHKEKVSDKEIQDLLKEIDKEIKKLFKD